MKETITTPLIEWAEYVRFIFAQEDWSFDERDAKLQREFERLPEILKLAKAHAVALVGASDLINTLHEMTMSGDIDRNSHVAPSLTLKTAVRNLAPKLSAAIAVAKEKA